ncbi:MAG: class I SAM-dependent methyltransferase [Schleiferiaceae bacterium]
MKQHWNHIFATKSPKEVSWTQPKPEPSLTLIQGLQLPLDARILEMGGGSSLLPDFLIKMGFQDITVVDISAEALNISKERVDSTSVQWVESDMRDFTPEGSFDLWHDRAAFHFLTEPDDIANYVAKVEESVTGYLIIGAFSENGPLKCSGLPVSRYSEESLQDLFKNSFETIETFTLDHTTPFDTQQNFVFGVFRRRE